MKVFSESGKLVDILCNKCNISCIPEEIFHIYENLKDQDLENNAYGLIESEVIGGYFSLNRIIRDCHILTFSLCENCLEDIIQTFKTSPDQEHYPFGDGPNAECDCED